MAEGKSFNFIIDAKENSGRRGRLFTPHGIVNTPAFMPVGTAGTVKGLISSMLKSCGVEIMLCNTFHLYLSPGTDVIKETGGLHGFTAFKGPILTDSGGFQVFSLSSIKKVTDDGVIFSSPYNGDTHFLTPELVIEIEEALGSDIIMPLDECLPYKSDAIHTKIALKRTLEWLLRSVKAKKTESQALFGIVQGGFFEDLRMESIEKTIQQDLSGFAVGGLSVGEDRETMYEIANQCSGALPPGKPRYLMGVGTPEDLLNCIQMGYDLFDCVLPTRNARNGMLFTSRGKIRIKRAEFTNNNNPPDPNCGCETCRSCSIAYLRHLFMRSEVSGIVYNTIHNIYFYEKLMNDAREAISSNQFADFKKTCFERMSENP